MDTPHKAGLPQAIVIILIGLLPMMAIVALMPIVPALISNFKDVPNIQTLAPLILSAPGLCVALFSPWAGYLTDRLGRRRLLIIFTLIYGIGGMAPFFIDSFPVLMGGRLLLGIGEAFVLTIGNTLLGDYFEKDQRAKWLMWQAIVGSTCGSLLLALSGYLSTKGWNFPFLVYGVALLISLGAVLYIYEPQRVRPAPAMKDAAGLAGFPRAMMLRLAATTIVLSALYFVYTLHFSLALDAMGVKDGNMLGIFSAIASVAVPLGAILFKLLSRTTSSFQFTTLFALIGTGMVGIGLGVDPRVAVAFAFIQQLGAGMVIPVLIGWSLRELPVQFRGRGMGLWCSAFFLGQFSSPLLVSVMRGWTGGLLSAFVAFGVICIVIALGNQLVSRRETPAPAAGRAATPGCS